MDGLKFVADMQATGSHFPPIGHLVGFQLIAVSKGSVTVTGLPEERHYNPLGVVHGGFAGTLLDLALGHACITALSGDETGVATTELSVRYLRPLFATTGTVTCVATVLYRGKNNMVADAQLRNAARDLCALAQCTCVIVRDRDRGDA